jgi:hypothetical protein
MRCDRYFGWVLAAGIIATPSAAKAQTFGYFGDLGPAYWVT